MSSAQVFDQYLLLERVATGSMAEVFRARALGGGPLAPDVAVKRLLPGLASDGWAAQQYLREVEALRRIDHPAVVTLLHAGHGNGLPYIAMPWLGGVNLRQLLMGLPALAAGQGEPPRRLAQPLAVAIAAQIAAGLAAAHQSGVVHRDLSPTNVQLSQEGRVVLIDFGIAQVAGFEPLDNAEHMPGKWAYASPEQRRGLPLDARTDLFALGLLLRELLTGQSPDGETDAHRQPVAGLPAEVDQLLNSLLAADPQLRLGDATHAAATLAQLAAAPVEFDLGASLRGLLALVPERPPAHEWSAAELRGETVTQPHLDPDATLVRMDGHPLLEHGGVPTPAAGASRTATTAAPESV